MTIKGKKLTLDKIHEDKIKKMIKIKDTPIDRNRSHGVKGLIMEIEGGFKGDPLNYESDGSVNIESDYENITDKISKKDVKKAIHNYFGESKSDLCTSDQEIKKYIFETFEIHLVKTNSSCGFHIHILVRSMADYSKLMKREFWSYFLIWLDWFSMTYEINHKHRWFNRLGQIGSTANAYCQRRFNPNGQINIKDKYDGDRYTFINFPRDVMRRIKGKSRRCKGKTIEFRVFCLFKSKWLSYELIRQLKKMVNGYLNCDEKLKFNDITCEDEFWRKNEDDHNGIYRSVSKTEYCSDCREELDECSCDTCSECDRHIDECRCNICDECDCHYDECECERS